MKIVHICLGGVYTEGWSYQENLLPKYHVKLGNEVTLITNVIMYNNNGNKVVSDDTNYINENGIKVLRLEEKNHKPLRKFQRYPQLYETIKKENPDIIFSHGCQYLDTDQIVKYKKKNPNVRIYVDNHADFSNSASTLFSKNILHKIIWRKSAQKLLPCTDKFYGVMPSRVEFLEQMYRVPKEKVELLVMGADDDKIASALQTEIRNSIRAQYGILPDDFLIITGGKIDLAKQQTIILMEAVNKLNLTNVKLLVFGSVTNELKDKVQNQCTSSVMYIGWIDSKNTDQYFAAADLVAFPGRHSVFWEQVAGMGIPMICKYWDGTTHVDVGGNVKFIHNDSVDEIISTLKNIICDKRVYTEMKQIAEGKGRKTFSYLEIAKKSIEFDKMVR